MSMTVLAHSLPDVLHLHDSQHHLRAAAVPISVHCSFLPFEDAQLSTAGGSCRRRICQFRATSGGSNRDLERLVARTQPRRPRDRKGGKPSKDDLMNELEEEEEAEEEAETVAELASDDSSSSPYEIVSSNPSETRWVKGEEMGVPSQDVKLSDKDKEGRKGSGIDPEPSLAQTEGVRNYRADFQPKVASNERASQVRNDLSEAEAQAEGAMNSIADAAMDTASDTGDKIRETGEEVEQDVAEVASIGESLLEDGRKNIRRQGEQSRKDISEAGAAVNVIADVAMDTASDTGKKIRETGEEVGQDIAEVASIGRSLLEDSSKAVSRRGEQIGAEARKTLDEEGEVLEQGADRLRSQARKSLSRVQDSVTRAVRETGKAAESVGREALVVGEVLLDTARDTLKATSAVFGDDARTENRRGNETQQPKENGFVRTGKRSQELQEEEKSRYADYNVLVAGASGRTGRSIVKTLVGKGATVRALVRDVYKVRSIQKLNDCEVVEADLYKYETLKKALGDCNVVICAIGARAPLDPFNTYQVEYEGVLNLISAAKNQGKVKKFILVSSIGVTFFQLIPLLFWKKQAELYLQRSGLEYTIVRPGGLRRASGDENEQVLIGGPDSRFFGGISREKVAEVCVAALSAPGACDKIVEVVGVPGIQRKSIDDLFKVV